MCNWHPTCKVLMSKLWHTPTNRRHTHQAQREVTMAKIRQTEIEEEPVGIVISSGSRAEKAPRLIAYVWGPAPEVEANGEMAAA